MPCPVCDQTMQGLGVVESGDRLFWCPTCGTLARRPPKETATEQMMYDRPRLPGRVAEFLKAAPQPDRALAHRLGIIEAIKSIEGEPVASGNITS